MTIDSSTIDQIIDTELNELDNQLSRMVEGDVTTLRAAAISFDNELKNLEDEINEFKALLKRQKEMRNANRDSKKYEEIPAYIQGKQQQSLFLKGDIPRRYYAAAEKFQAIINQFIGQTVTTIYVYENNGSAELYEVKSNDVLKFDVASRGYNFIARYNPNLNELQSAMSKVSLNEPFNFNFEGLQGAYKETLFRYRVSRKHKNRIVLWQNPQTVWHHAFISTEGDINETYAVIILQNNRTPGFNSGDIELNVEEFVTATFDVTNESGMLSGDTTLDNIEYAIKSANASTLSINQLRKLANDIIKDAHFDKQKMLDLKAKLKKQARARNTANKALKEEVEKTILAEIQGIGN